MPAPLSTLQVALSMDSAPFLGPSAPGLNSLGGPLFVANDNTLQAQAQPHDPWHILAGNDTNGDHVRPFACNFGMYINLYHMWTNSNQTPAALTVNVYGACPPWNGPAAERAHPFDDDSTNLPDLDALDGLGKRLWVPLHEVESTDDPPTVALPAGVASAYTQGTDTFAISKGTTFYRGGCTHCIVTVDTAATGVTSGQIVARLVG